MGLIEHLERHLGEIEGGWAHDADGENVPFQVVRFGKGSAPGTVTFATVGLSRKPLRGRKKEIRHELIIIVSEQLRDGPVPGILQQVGLEILASQKPLLRGDVIGPRNELFSGSAMRALYAALPVYFPDSFSVCEENGYEIAIVWLIPISANEANYVFKHGWMAFEEKLAAVDPDLADVFRAEIPL